MKNKIGRMAGQKRIDHEIDHAMLFILCIPTISTTSPLPLFISFWPLFGVHSPDICHYATLIPMNLFIFPSFYHSLSSCPFLSLPHSPMLSLSLPLYLSLSVSLSYSLTLSFSHTLSLSLSLSSSLILSLTHSILVYLISPFSLSIPHLPISLFLHEGCDFPYGSHTNGKEKLWR